MMTMTTRKTRETSKNDKDVNNSASSKTKIKEILWIVFGMDKSVSNNDERLFA